MLRPRAADERRACTSDLQSTGPFAAISSIQIKRDPQLTTVSSIREARNARSYMCTDGLMKRGTRGLDDRCVGLVGADVQRDDGAHHSLDAHLTAGRHGRHAHYRRPVA
jgi:hypothetical protein